MTLELFLFQISWSAMLLLIIEN